MLVFKIHFNHQDLKQDLLSASK